MIEGKAHVQNVGWTEFKSDGETIGTTGLGLRLEALIINSDYRLRYKAHVQNVGWQDWVSRGEVAGTEGQGLRMEAFKIELLDDTEMHVWYRVHVENVGWTDWAIDGAIVGSVGQSLRMEAVEIQIVDAASNEAFKKWYEDSLKCKLGDVIFTSTTGESATVSNEITDKPIEGGTISDHAQNNPTTMNVSGIIVGDDAQEKIEIIRGYVKDIALLRYVGVDTAQNMLISSFTTDRSVSLKGGAAFTLALKEVGIATGVVTVIDEAFVSTQMNNLKNGGLQAVLRE
ncbi:MAG: hypothetical protein CVU99_02400 [Firmicutes bacterium HGW-Firmicutes-4]|jgi:hypothetical protein|nr:MAG: hypothetical protein CVU99_02400 [Firmicutes bacterium HGW-Firmicutes-4]